MSCFHHHVDCDYTKFFFVDIVIEAMYHISLIPSKNASNINRVKPRFMQCFAKYVQPPQWLQILLWAGQFSHWLGFNQFSQIRQLLTLRPLISFAVFLKIPSLLTICRVLPAMIKTFSEWFWGTRLYGSSRLSLATAKCNASTAESVCIHNCLRWSSFLILNMNKTHTIESSFLPKSHPQFK